MIGKKWGIGLGIVGLIALLFFWAQVGTRTVDVGTGTQLRVKKTTTPYHDWNTGSELERTEFTLYYKGSKVDSSELKKWLDVKHAGLAESPRIVDATELKADDILLMLAKGSQGTSYLVVRIHLDPGTTAVQTEVIDLGGEESQYSWFPDSRSPAWVRAVTTNGAQFMIRRSPFKVTAAGFGELAKVELPYAFVASDKQDAPQISFTAVNLDNGSIAASLNLDKDCFALPRFAFDHPKLYANDLAQSDEEVKYNYGPKWWNKNIAWAQPSATLTLKTDHALAAPAGKKLAIQHEVVKAEAVPSGGPTDVAMAESAPLFNEGEIDQIPVITKNCEKVNPNGVKKAQSMYATTENIDAAVFCLRPGWPVDPALRDQACGTPTRKKVFSSTAATVNEVSFAYHPVHQQSAPIPIVVPEIEVDGKRFISVDDPDDASQNLKEAYVLNEGQILFKARSTGPWMIFLMGGEGKDFSIQKIGWIAYPSGPFSEIGKGKFLYDSKSRVLVRKKPFGYLDRVNGLADIQDQKAVALFEQDDKLHVRVVQFTADARMVEQAISSLEVPVSCFGNGGMLPDGGGFAERQKWFNKNFAWSSDQSKVGLAAPCRKR